MKTSVFNLKKIEFNCLKLNNWRSVVEFATPKNDMMNIISYINDVKKCDVRCSLK